LDATQGRASAYQAGWAKSEAPLLSRDAFQEFVAQYQEAGIQRLAFTLNNAAIFEQAAAAGAVVGREALEVFAADAPFALGDGARSGVPARPVPPG
jgi:hypothetical protein